MYAKVSKRVGIVSAVAVLSTFLVHPALLQASGSPRQHLGAAPKVPDPRIEELLRTSYLGHAEDFPDPDEPYEILAQYLRRDTHKYLTSPGSPTTAQDLDLDISLWEALVACTS